MTSMFGKVSAADRRNPNFSVIERILQPYLSINDIENDIFLKSVLDIF